MTDMYILDGKKAIPADLMTWARWYETADRTVAKTATGNGDVSHLITQPRCNLEY